MQISVDGYVAGPNGEMDWMVWDWDDVLKNYVTALTEPVDCILLGRKLAAGFIPTWTSRLADPETTDSFAKKMVDTHKVVFSKALQKSEWENTSLATGNLADEVNQIKNMEGSDIMVYGGAEFVSNLVHQNLIDELNLFINPAALGSGMKIFGGKTNLSLIKSVLFGCGINLLCYQPVRK